MSTPVSYDDFDTVCYSTIDNLIRIIEILVKLGVDVGNNESAVNAANVSISNLASQIAGFDIGNISQESHDAYLLSQNLNTRLSAVEHDFKALWEWEPAGRASPIGQYIRSLEKRIEDLGG